MSKVKATAAAMGDNTPLGGGPLPREALISSMPLPIENCHASQPDISSRTPPMTTTACRRLRAQAMAPKRAKKYSTWIENWTAMSGIVTPTTKKASEVTAATLSGHRRRTAIGAAIATKARYSAQIGWLEMIPPALRTSSSPRAERTKRTTESSASARPAPGSGSLTQSSSSAKNSAARTLTPVRVTPTA